MKKRKQIELTGLKALGPDELLSKKQCRWLLAGTVSDSFLYGLFSTKLKDKVTLLHGEEYLFSGDIVSFIEGEKK